MKLLVTAVALALVPCRAVFAAAQAPAPAKPAVSAKADAALAALGAVRETDPKYPPVVYARLKNGMQVVILERKMSPTISFNVFFKVGNVDNPVGKTGLAHLFEHMIFKGTKTIGSKDFSKEKPLMDKVEKIGQAIYAEQLKGPEADQKKIDAMRKDLMAAEEAAGKFIERNEYQKVFQSLGAVGLNAMTSNDYTGYVLSLPANQVERWMVVESDRFRNPVLREFYKERDVVLEEMRMNDSQPRGLLWKHLLAYGFMSHPYRNPIIGWESDISRLTRTDAEEYFKTYYGPNNATVAIVGDVDAAATIKLLKKYFEGIPARPVPQILKTEDPAPTAEKRVAVFFKAEPMLALGYRVPGSSSSDYPALFMTASVLSSGRTGRLYKNLVEGSQVAAGIGAGSGTPGVRYPNLFIFIGAPRAPHTVAELESGVYGELHKLWQQPPSQEELQKIVNQYEADIIKEMEQNMGMAHTLAYSQMIQGDWRYDWQLLEKLRSVKPEDVSRVTAKYFTRSNRTVVWLENPETPAPAPAAPAAGKENKQ